MLYFFYKYTCHVVLHKLRMFFLLLLFLNWAMALAPDCILDFLVP